MKRLITYYLKPYYPNMAVGFFIKFIGTIMDLLLPWILAYMIDSVIPRKSMPDIYFYGGVMVLCALLAVSFNIIANRMASKVGRDTTTQIRQELFSKVMYLSNRQMDEYTKPSIISRLTTDTYNIHQMVGMIQRMGVRAPILLIGGIIVTLTLDVSMTLVLIAILPFIVALTTFVSKKTIPMYAALQESIDRFVRLVREDVVGIRVIKALSKTGFEKSRFARLNEDVVKNEKKASMTMAAVNPAMDFFMNMGLVAVIYVGAVRVNSGLTEVGKILAFMTYFSLILNSMMMISRIFVMISKAIASADRIMMIMEAKEDFLIEDLDEKESDAFIEFDQVSFSYDQVEDNLTDLSFRLKKGETLGIIGATGSGKTTIVNLLMRFYDTVQGSIYIDGKNIKSFSLVELREKFGVVFQNDILFVDSIKENIRFGRELSEEEVQNAALYARAKEFVEQEKSEGFEEKLSIRGANLSGGQKQRVLIARALAAHPDILILDDSSSALDYKTDAALRKEIRENFQDTTTIIIAQRISSVMQAEHIIVVDDGKMIGYGTHDELVQECEIYREISLSQMGEGA